MSVVDWGTVIPTVVTGVVGLAGIGGSIVSARIASKSAVMNLERSISAEDKRVKRADKRLVYANCLAAIWRYKELSMLSGRDLKTFDQQLGLRTSEADSELRKARAAVLIASQEVSLIGPSRVERRIYEVQSADIGDAEEWARNYSALVEVMREDLDKPTGLSPPD